MDRNSWRGNADRDGGYTQEDFSSDSSMEYGGASRERLSMASSDDTSQNSP